MKRILKITITWYILAIMHINTYSIDAVITLFIQRYPYVSKTLQQEYQNDKLDTLKYSKKLQQPDYIYRTITQAHNNFKHELPGIMCLYAGQIALSNGNGQISFPRQQQTPNMYILVSKGIKPAYIVAPTTIHNWVLDVDHPVDMYFMQLKHDPVTTLSYYETTKINSPTDQNIPLNTIVFIADPQSVYIPLGATIVDYSPNIILPPIYIKKGFCFVYNSLYTLAIKQYFESTNISVKQDGATIAQIQQII